MQDENLLRELESQRDEIARQKKEIIYSLQYASLIQSALLPPDRIIKMYLPDYFVLYLPKDIISGDFYWLAEADECVLFAAADCTGHGVPGALMSILGISFLNETLKEKCHLKANRILNQLREKIMKALHQTGERAKSKDGMDIALCIYNPTTGELQYSGANNPLYFIRGNELEEIRPDKMPIGISGTEELSFANHLLQMESGDIIYLFSDGFADQFGGPEGKKFKYKPFKQLLFEIHKKPMPEQKDILVSAVYDWKGDLDQVDDILIMGVRF
ncbi:MAG: SpoIIE family protein phosphatase [Bacteroidales bacterium]|nr:MAG: SpoIIE family protein phosphatase [Bacteroidales bacterium]